MVMVFTCAFKFFLEDFFINIFFLVVCNIILIDITSFVVAVKKGLQNDFICNVSNLIANLIKNKRFWKIPRYSLCFELLYTNKNFKKLN